MRDVLLAVLFALNVSAQTPSGLYTLTYVEVIPGPAAGCTNWQYLVRTDTNALPVAVIETNATKIPVPNLQFGMKYFLSAKGQSNGVWSAESPFYLWPHALTNYVARITQTAPSVNGDWQDVPGSLVTDIDPPVSGLVYRQKIWASNNIAPYVLAQ